MNNRLFELLGQLHIHLERSGSAYREYLQGGKTFLFARILRLYNEKIRSLILEKGYLLPDSLQKDGLALVAHYDVWMQRWDDLQQQLSPSPDDLFVFPNEVTFPKQAAQHIEQEYKRLKQEMAHA